MADEPAAPGATAADAGQNTGSGPGTGDPNPAAGGGNGGQTSAGGGATVAFTPEQQAYIDNLMGKARSEGRTAGKRDAETAAEAAKRQADEQAKAEQGQFKPLYEAEQLKVKELEPEAAKAKRLSERVNSIIDGEIATWPDEVKALDPGKDDPEVRASWVEKSRALAQRIKDASSAPRQDHGSGSGAGPGSIKEASDAAIKNRYKIPGAK